MIGVYAIHCLITGRRYIGSSTNVENRWSVHKSELKLNKHYSIELQEDYNKIWIRFSPDCGICKDTDGLSYST